MIQLTDIHKKYGRHEVLRHINLSVRGSQALGIIGANGSGKSTLLRIIAGMLQPSGGRIEQYGARDRLKVGFVPERFPQMRLTLKEYLYAMGKFQSLSSEDLGKRIAELTDWLGMACKEDRMMNEFSKGMLQKVNLMQAILGNPDLLVLDEPLSGLDANSQLDLVPLLTGLKEQGMAIVLSCHEALLLDGLADRIAVLQDGELREAASDRGPATDVALTFTLPASEAAASFKRIHGGSMIEASKHQYELRALSSEVNALLRAILEAEGTVLSVIPDPSGWVQVGSSSCSSSEKGGSRVG